ncbi:hypothetical protein BGZ65_008315, partial [Modicella reniformis]
MCGFFSTVIGLSTLGWEVFLADGEADLAIVEHTRDIRGVEFVVSHDSDFLIHPNVHAIYRPTSKLEFLYGLPQRLFHQPFSSDGIETRLPPQQELALDASFQQNNNSVRQQKSGDAN